MWRNVGSAWRACKVRGFSHSLSFTICLLFLANLDKMPDIFVACTSLRSLKWQSVASLCLSLIRQKYYPHPNPRSNPIIN